MSSEYVKVLVPAPVAAPRGAAWAADAVVWIARTLFSRRPAAAPRAAASRPKGPA